MKKGRKKCETLKEVRRRIAEANDIEYSPKECHYEGPCKGTCPACEAEMRYIEDSLAKRRRSGFPVRVAGVALGLSTLTSSAAQTEKSDTVETSKVEVSQTLKTNNWADCSTDTVHIKGMVMCAGEPLIGAGFFMFDNMKVAKEGKINRKHAGTTDINGCYSVIVPRKAVIKFSYIGLKTVFIKVADLMKKPNFSMEDNTSLMGEVITVRRDFDDVYRRGTSKDE